MLAFYTFKKRMSPGCVEGCPHHVALVELAEVVGVLEALLADVVALVLDASEGTLVVGVEAVEDVLVAVVLCELVAVPEEVDKVVVAGAVGVVDVDAGGVVLAGALWLVAGEDVPLDGVAEPVPAEELGDVCVLDGCAGALLPLFEVG